MTTEDLVGRAIVRRNGDEKPYYDILVIIGVTKCIAGDELVLQTGSGYKERVPFRLVKGFGKGEQSEHPRYELVTEETVRKLEKRWNEA